MPKQILHSVFDGGMNVDLDPRQIGDNQVQELKNAVVSFNGTITPDFARSQEFANTMTSTVNSVRLLRSDYNMAGTAASTDIFVIVFYNGSTTYTVRFIEYTASSYAVGSGIFADITYVSSNEPKISVANGTIFITHEGSDTAYIFYQEEVTFFDSSGLADVPNYATSVGWVKIDSEIVPEGCVEHNIHDNNYNGGVNSSPHGVVNDVGDVSPNNKTNYQYFEGVGPSTQVYNSTPPITGMRTLYPRVDDANNDSAGTTEYGLRCAFNANFVASADPLAFDGNLNYQFGLSIELHNGERGPVYAMRNYLNMAITYSTYWTLDMNIIYRFNSTTLNKAIKGVHVYHREFTTGDTEDWLALGFFDFGKGFRKQGETSYTKAVSISRTMHDGDSGVHLTSCTVTGLFPGTVNYSDYLFIPNEAERVSTFDTAFMAGQRLFALSPDGDKDRVIVSAPRKVTELWKQDYLEITEEDGDSFVSGEDMGSEAVLWKKNTMYIINIASYDPASFYVASIFPNMGIAREQAKVKTPYGIFFCNEFGVFLYTGGQVPANIISNRMEAKWASIYGANPWVAYCPTQKALYVSNSNNNDVMIFSIETNSWSISDVISESISYNMSPVHSSVLSEFYYVNTQGINKIDTSTRRSTDVTIKTRRFDFGNPSIRRKLKAVYIEGSEDITAASLTCTADPIEVAPTALTGPPEDIGDTFRFVANINFRSLEFTITLGSPASTNTIKGLSVVWRNKSPK